jgi:hypothetical protein
MSPVNARPPFHAPLPRGWKGRAAKVAFVGKGFRHGWRLRSSSASVGFCRSRGWRAARGLTAMLAQKPPSSLTRLPRVHPRTDRVKGRECPLRGQRVGDGSAGAGAAKDLGAFAPSGGCLPSRNIPRLWPWDERASRAGLSSKHSETRPRSLDPFIRVLTGCRYRSVDGFGAFTLC